MRIRILAAMVFCLAATTAGAGEKQQVEQKPGQPLYFPAGEYKPHPSDLAPETDPQWQRFEHQQRKRIEQGKPAENPYEDAPTVIREESTTYEIVDENKKKRQPPKRWE